MIFGLENFSGPQWRPRVLYLNNIVLLIFYLLFCFWFLYNRRLVKSCNAIPFYIRTLFNMLTKLKITFCSFAIYLTIVFWSLILISAAVHLLEAVFLYPDFFSWNLNIPFEVHKSEGHDKNRIRFAFNWICSCPHRSR